MGLYTEFIPGSSGVRGEAAPLRDANKLAWYRSWSGKAVVIGPISVAYAGYWPDFDNKVEFDAPALILCGSLRRSNGTIKMSEQAAESGTRIEDPLVFDAEAKAFGELLDERDKAVTYLWVPDSAADCIRAISDSIPYVTGRGDRVHIPAEELSPSIF